MAVCPPFIAARCDEDRTALSAAFAGSRACSIKEFSWPDWRYVGDELFCPPSKKSFLVEYFRDTPTPDWPVEGVGTGGDMVVELS
jgi:hypothetical protein